MLNKLNGWQRLWVVISVIWISFILIIGYSSRPEIPNEEKYVYWILNEEEERIAKDEYSFYIKDRYFSTIEIISQYNSKARVQLNPDEIKTYTILIEKYPKLKPIFLRQISSLQDSKALKTKHKNELNKFYVSIILFACIPPLIICLLFLGIVWIIKGFKKTVK